MARFGWGVGGVRAASMLCTSRGAGRAGGRRFGGAQALGMRWAAQGWGCRRSPLLKTHVLLGRGTGLVRLVHGCPGCPGCQAAVTSSGAHQAGLYHAAAAAKPSSWSTGSRHRAPSAPAESRSHRSRSGWKRKGTSERYQEAGWTPRRVVPKQGTGFGSSTALELGPPASASRWVAWGQLPARSPPGTPTALQPTQAPATP